MSANFISSNEGARQAAQSARDSLERKSWSRIEFCERHGISLGMFHLLVKSGALHARKIGAKTIVTVDDEAAWLASLPRAA